jgi:hypothetical protein
VASDTQHAPKKRVYFSSTHQVRTQNLSLGGGEWADPEAIYDLFDFNLTN